MIVSEDGTVTGSIDHSKLSQVEPKTDEARAQIEQLQREQQEGARQADADAARIAAVHAAQSPWTVEPAARDNRDVQGKAVGAPEYGAGDQSGPVPDRSADASTKDTGASSARKPASSGGKD